MKRIKTWLTTITVLLCSIMAKAQNFEVDGINYYVTSAREVQVSYATENLSGDVLIPETVSYNGTAYNVTSISTGAFQGNERITSLIISKNITSIGNYAFQYCSNLTSVSILGNITSIGSSMFDSCSNLVSVTIPESVTVINGGAFSNCSSLTNIVFPEGLTEIGYGVFENCSKLTSIVIPQKVSLIQSGTFRGCTALKSIIVNANNNTYDSRNNCNAIIETKTNTLIQGCASSTIPSTVTSIGSYAFDGCSSLTSIVLPNSVTKIGYQAFQDCSSMTSVNIPTGVTSINGSTFSGCSSLKSIIIPFTVTSIGNYAFYGCSSLTEITIPKSVTKIEQSTFSDCPNLASIIVESGNNKYDSRNNCNAIIETATNTLIQGCSSTVIPNSVSSIGHYAFNGCTNLTSIAIPESITEIESGAFRNCSSLTIISLPKNLKSLEYMTFHGCTALKTISIPQNITTIDGGAFGDCSSLQSINIPTGVTVLEDNSFYGCTSLKEVIFENGTEDLLLGYKAFNDSPLETIYLGRNLTYQNNASNIFYQSKTLKSLTVGDNVKEVKSYQFQNCENLTSVVIEKGITKIGSQAFNGCSKLSVVEHSGSNLVLESRVFTNCTSLKTFDLSGVISIGQAAFENTGLESIHFPASVLTVDGIAFANMKNLKTITIAKDFKADLKWGMPNCTAIESITVEEGNTRYDSRENCNALIQKETSDVFLLVGSKNSFIPSGVTKIGPYAFMTMPMAGDIVIPSSVNAILGYAFAGTTIKSITCYSATPPTIDGPVFADVDTSIPVYVPASSVSDYATASGWSAFTNIIPMDRNVEINDRSENYANSQEISNMNITYTRTLNNTKWNALYLPFEIPVTAEFLEDYEVAYINAMHSYDEDDNGEIDRLSQEIVKIKNGTLHANHPYLIRAKTEEAKQMNITVENAKLYKAESVTLDCSSVYTKFEITGIYEKMTSAQLAGCYALSGGVWQPVAEGASLNPFRLYMRITERGGSPYKVSSAALARIGIHVKGEETATSIEEMEAGEQGTSAIYDLTGKRVLRPTKGQIYIVNGKKRVY